MSELNKNENDGRAASNTLSELLCCPHCGGDYGFYRIVRMSGRTQYNYGFDGADCNNSGLHDSLNYRENKKAFCIECDKEIKQLKAT